MQPLLDGLIAAYLKKNHQEAVNPEKFRISEAGRCRLMRYLKRRGVPPSNAMDDRMLRVFEVGTVIHRLLQDVLRKHDVLIAEEFLVEDAHRRGHIDALVRFEGKTILYDFKTISAQRLATLEAPSRNYLFQIVTYAELLPMPVDDLRIAFVEKDSLSVVEFSVRESCDYAALSEEVAEDWRLLIDAWERRCPPVPDPATVGVECPWCVYRDYCAWAPAFAPHPFLKETLYQAGDVPSTEVEVLKEFEDPNRP